MRIAYLTFSNSQQAPLLTLQEEDDKIHKSLAQRDVAHHFRLHRDSFSTIPKIAEYLLLFQEQIVLFHFSGHAGRDQLLLDDSAANAVGIAQLLGRCPNLQLVVLNGCSTKGQVSALLEAGVPVVIATSAPVQDRMATQFAISFYQSLADGFKSIREAFEDGIAAAQTESKQALKVERTRGISAFSNAKKDEPLWGLHCREESDLDWKLPLGDDARPPDFEPNEMLIKRLLEAFSPYDKEVDEIRQQGRKASGGTKKVAILKCLPHPISQQLRKLMVKEIGSEQYVFYDKPDANRLWQIGYAYATLLELLAFILLAELWKELDNPERLKPLDIPSGSLDPVKAFFSRSSGDKTPFDFVALIRSIRLILEQNELPFFVEELKEVSRIFNENTEFTASCRFLEALRHRFHRQGLMEPDAAQLCPMAESKLATVFAELGFLARYSLLSVQDIKVLKYRYPTIARFNHKFILLKQQEKELELEEEIMGEFMDASSVIIQRKNAHGSSRFLNLSPFVIDKSAFDEKAILVNLFFFEGYEQSLDVQRYRNVYKPADQRLVVRDQEHFEPLKEQFEGFAQSLFHQSLQAL